MSEHWEYTTHVKRVGDGVPWPMRQPNVLIKGDWWANQKIISIEPFHTKYSSGLEVWWIERVMVQDVPPPPPAAPEPSDYEKLREELKV